MRAVHLNELPTAGESKTLEGPKAHHLLNVVRVKPGETILGMNGAGDLATIEVITTSKRKLEVKCLSVDSKPKSGTQVDLLVSKVKKEAMDLIFKQSCELGINKVIVAETEFAQRYKLNEERVEKLFVSALEQSNNPYLPLLSEQKLNQVDLSEYDGIFYFSSNAGVDELGKIEANAKYLIIIGPEGGMSSDEEKFLQNLKNGMQIKLNIPIMRSPTAMACAIGYIHGRIS